jgi:hypothetical protein
MTAVKRLMTGNTIDMHMILMFLEYRELTNNAPEGILAGRFCDNGYFAKPWQVQATNPTFLNGNVIFPVPKAHHLKVAYSLQLFPSPK